MQKWEYCLLKQQSAREIWLYKGAEKEKFKGNEVTLAQVLEQLGKDGWEAINFAAKDLSAGYYSVWPEAQQREIFFKRPLQD